MSVFANRTDQSARQPTAIAGEPTKPARNGKQVMTEESDAEEGNPPETAAIVQGNSAAFSDIEEAARIRLQHSHYRAIRRVNCVFEDGVLTLTGAVPTFHYKQLAQTAVADIPGVRQVVNQIDVG